MLIRIGKVIGYYSFAAGFVVGSIISCWVSLGRGDYYHVCIGLEISVCR
jgi:hypothetical protein